MDRKRIVEVFFTVLVAVLLLIAATGKHSYSFYVVLRLVVTVGAVSWAVRVYQAKLYGWIWPFAVVALLMNPFVPIRMHRADWQPIDLCLSLLLLGWSGYWSFRRTG
jgi:hypothetical protein